MSVSIRAVHYDDVWRNATFQVDVGGQERIKALVPLPKADIGELVKIMEFAFSSLSQWPLPSEQYPVSVSFFWPEKAGATLQEAKMVSQSKMSETLRKKIEDCFWASFRTFEWLRG